MAEKLLKKSRGKVIVVGDGGCGKTCFLEVFQQNRFPVEYIPTIIDNFNKEVQIDVNPVVFSIWDTAGEEEYDAVRGLAYKETDVVLLCYQIDRPVSLENIVQKWIKEVRNYLPNSGLILVGLKADIRDLHNDDLDSSKKFVPYEEGVRVKELIGADAFIETSARENKNIQETFVIAGKWIIENKTIQDVQKKWYYCFCC